MEILRTPDDRFAALTDYPFAPHYVERQGLRMHYVDEGNGPPVLLLHGEPSWSYLYREIIPPLVDAGFRCIAPDHIGFGKSDKVVDDSWYVIERHTEGLRHLIETLGLRGMTIVVHDWGGPIGLRQVADMPERFSRLVVLNTWLHNEGFVYTEAIRNWRRFATGFEPGTGDLPAGMIVSAQLQVDEERRARIAAAYEAPFPDARYKAGARRFPWCIPFAQPVEGNAADQERCFAMLKKLPLPAHFIFGDRDGVFTAAWAREWAAQMQNATVETVPGPHFPQEESAARIAGLMLGYLKGS